MEDPYRVLGISRTASKEDVKAAFREKALEWHPDRHAEGDRKAAQERFQAASEAYRALTKEDPRAATVSYRGTTVKTGGPQSTNYTRSSGPRRFGFDFLRPLHKAVRSVPGGETLWFGVLGLTACGVAYLADRSIRAAWSARNEEKLFASSGSEYLDELHRELEQSRGEEPSQPSENETA